MPNTRRFQRVDRGLQRHVRSGELWFVGRRGKKVIWKRLRTHHLQVARATVAMMDSKINGDHEISLVVDEKTQPLADTPPVKVNKPLRRVRQVTLDADAIAPPTKQAPVPQAAPSGATPTLEALLLRCRSAKVGLKRGTEVKLDAQLTMLRRYVTTNLPVTDYTPQIIREYLAKARADKDSSGQRRLKGQTINESISRPLHDAFNLAVEERFLDRNPMTLVKREKSEPINRTQLKWEEAHRMLEYVKPRAYQSYLQLKFMLVLGVGQAEAKDVTGGAVDWQERKITFIRRKTGKQYHVPIYSSAEDFIRTEIEPRLQPGKPVFDWRNPRKALETACKSLNLPVVDIRSLRRTLIIHLLQQGVDVRVIAMWQGHGDARLILSRYGNYINPDHEKRELAKLNASAGQK